MNSHPTQVGQAPTSRETRKEEDKEGEKDGNEQATSTSFDALMRGEDDRREEEKEGRKGEGEERRERESWSSKMLVMGSTRWRLEDPNNSLTALSVLLVSFSYFYSFILFNLTF